ncbi:MAG TPA: hypothetical protein VMW23_03530 [Sedimentisphaerales bacterium]|nr:hypothetical protein [Sedimentisphaerales bacterium]
MDFIKPVYTKSFVPSSEKTKNFVLLEKFLFFLPDMPPLNPNTKYPLGGFSEGLA